KAFPTFGAVPETGRAGTARGEEASVRRESDAAKGLRVLALKACRTRRRFPQGYRVGTADPRQQLTPRGVRGAASMSISVIRPQALERIVSVRQRIVNSQNPMVKRAAGTDERPAVRRVSQELHRAVMGPQGPPHRVGMGTQIPPLEAATVAGLASRRLMAVE